MSEIINAIAQGDERKAGMLAAHLVAQTNAQARIKRGVSGGLMQDPLYGRMWNIKEYFDNPRAATAKDDLGAICDWSI